MFLKMEETLYVKILEFPESHFKLYDAIRRNKFSLDHIPIFLYTAIVSFRVAIVGSFGWIVHAPVHPIDVEMGKKAMNPDAIFINVDLKVPQ